MTVFLKRTDFKLCSYNLCNKTYYCLFVILLNTIIIIIIVVVIINMIVFITTDPIYR